MAVTYDEVNWTIWTTSYSGGAKKPCAGIFELESVFLGTLSFDAVGPSYTNDSLAPQSNSEWNSSSHPHLIYFDDSVSEVDRTVSTCGTGAQTFYDNSTFIDVQIPFAYDGIQYLESAAYPSYQEYIYTLPANGGVWIVDDHSLAGGTGGGWAFAWLHAC